MLQPTEGKLRNAHSSEQVIHLPWKKFYSFLIKCQRITADITWNAVNTPNTLCSLLVNFPGIMKDRWNRLVYNLRRHQERDAEYVDLVNFVEEETILVTNPLDRWQNIDALDCFTDKEQRSDQRNREVKTYAIKADITGKEKKCRSPCHMRKKNNDIDNY